MLIIDPGIFTTIQDAGRWGYQSYGVPVSGAMDWFAFEIANRLVGNSPNDAALEIRSPISLQTDALQIVALTGAVSFLKIDGRIMPTWASVLVRAGSLIEIAPQRAGGWRYLAVRGGIDVPRVLGSRSTDLRSKFGGLDGRALQSGDQIVIGESIGDAVAYAGRFASAQAHRIYDRPSPIRIVPGPHADWFTLDALAQIVDSAYTLTDLADRMGYRLSGASLTRARRSELISCGVTLGAMQIPADGQPIVLMADHQTTGGYPIIANVIRADMIKLAQRAPEEMIRFEWIDLAQAQQALIAMQNF